MKGNDFLFWLVVGLVPYYVNLQPVRNGWELQVRALFWSLKILLQKCGGHRLILHIILIERLHKAFWAIIMHLRGGVPPHE